jgi:hypothetical protein
VKSEWWNILIQALVCQLCMALRIRKVVCLNIVSTSKVGKGIEKYKTLLKLKLGQVAYSFE